MNKGTAFTAEERRKFGLVGILPPVVQDIDTQAEQVYQNLENKPDVSEKRHYLMTIFSSNRTLFYYVFKNISRN